MLKLKCVEVGKVGKVKGLGVSLNERNTTELYSHGALARGFQKFKLCVLGALREIEFL